MEKVIIMATCMIAVLLLLTGCGKKEEPETVSFVGLANPWIECGTLKEASELTGFEVSMPEEIEGYPYQLIQAIKESTVQQFYSDKEMSDPDRNVVLLRKGKGTEDISGDYNTYEKEETVTIQGMEVHLRENGGLVYVATWTQGGYAYAIDADKGLTATETEGLVKNIK